MTSYLDQEITVMVTQDHIAGEDRLKGVDAVSLAIEQAAPWLDQASTTLTDSGEWICSVYFAGAMEFAELPDEVQHLMHRIDCGDRVEPFSFKTSIPAPSWHLWAYEHESGRLSDVGPEPFVHAHGLPYPVVPVTVTEVPADAPDATHWGWFWSGRDNWCGGAPCMIWPSKAQFEMCFTYGVKAEEEAGHGRAARLRVTKNEGGEKG